MRTLAIKLLLLLLLPVLVLALYAPAATAESAMKHPTEVEVPALCSTCHQDWRGALDHTAEFGKFRHRFMAQQYGDSCKVCHVESFCSDCHAHREFLKPSDKFKDSPERDLPHRGDYINQHKIDGRVDPTSCMKCHGRQNNERCKTCHK